MKLTQSIPADNNAIPIPNSDTLMKDLDWDLLYEAFHIVLNHTDMYDYGVDINPVTFGGTVNMLRGMESIEPGFAM
jgi:hypothetical protein